MRRKMEWEWERLDESTWRAKVLGGWLVKSEYVAGKMPATTMQFVADRDHDWTIVKPMAESQKQTVKSTDFEPK